MRFGWPPQFAAPRGAPANISGHSGFWLLNSGSSPSMFVCGSGALYYSSSISFLLEKIFFKRLGPPLAEQLRPSPSGFRLLSSGSSPSGLVAALLLCGAANLGCRRLQTALRDPQGFCRRRRSARIVARSCRRSFLVGRLQPARRSPRGFCRQRHSRRDRPPLLTPTSPRRGRIRAICMTSPVTWQTTMYGSRGSTNPTFLPGRPR